MKSSTKVSVPMYNPVLWRAECRTHHRLVRDIIYLNIVSPQCKKRNLSESSSILQGSTIRR
ncbi:hypothetical protein CHS0354_035105 [Potamilus streckersoni]|uniref:Uncharacterized protein n=1 Tax=Potamilus streckersoni TaxID=2493646 RepID=A0AAE0RTW2_9BIVA|nr:hypothetical protein CHS0354_035105 [Potamilus streckersoni]